MKPTLRIGDTAEFSRIVPEDEVVCRLFSDATVMADMPAVFASAYMIGMMEWACVEQLAPHYEPGEGSLGTGFDLTHTAPTPPGLRVTVQSTVAQIDGKFVWFDLRAHDGVDEIGAGRHQRAVVQWDRFNARVAAKANGVPA